MHQSIHAHQWVCMQGLSIALVVLNVVMIAYFVYHMVVEVYQYSVVLLDKDGDGKVRQMGRSSHPDSLCLCTRTRVFQRIKSQWHATPSMHVCTGLSHAPWLVRR